VIEAANEFDVKVWISEQVISYLVAGIKYTYLLATFLAGFLFCKSVCIKTKGKFVFIGFKELVE
jgi:hypothetical protein